MQYEDSTVQTQRDVGKTVVVVIADCATYRVHRWIKSGLLRHIFELTANVVKKCKSAFWAIVGQQNVNATIIVIVKETCAWAEERSKVLAVACWRFRYDSPTLGPTPKQ